MRYILAMAKRLATPFCTLYYDSLPHNIPLPVPSPEDCHVFPKEQLAALGVQKVMNRAIQVRTVDIYVVMGDFAWTFGEARAG